MKALNNSKRTRLKMSVYSAIFLGVVILYAIYENLENVATAAIALFGTITTTYIIGDSLRKSEKDGENQ